MDSVLTDPYEQKLYHMFSTHGVDGQGSIDVEALKRLCKSLELKETGTKIIRALVKTGDDSSVRITFKAFKEELLHVLGTEIDTIGHSNQAKHHEVENSENKGNLEIKIIYFSGRKKWTIEFDCLIAIGSRKSQYGS